MGEEARWRGCNCGPWRRCQMHTNTTIAHCTQHRPLQHCKGLLAAAA